MKLFVPFVLLFLAFNLGLNAQLNQYKYIIVPKKFETFKRENQHLTSTLIKYLFVQKGYNAVYEGDFPEDLKNNACLGLKVDLVDDSSFFKTKAGLVLQDCELKTVFSTLQGTSKSKDYKEAYEKAIREAFSAFDIVDYNYAPKEEEEKGETVVLNFKNDVKSLDDSPNDKAVQQTATVTEQSYESKEPVASSVEKNAEKEMKKSTSSTSAENLLYAQKTEHGYNLTNANATIEYRLLSTSVDNIYLWDEEGQNGVVFKKDGKWYLESADRGQKVLKELNIKF